MKESDIRRASEIKRQLDGVRALRRGGARVNGDLLRFGGFKVASGCSLGASTDFPASLDATREEAADILNKMEKRLAHELAALGVTE